jgi:RND family efflux transporter MFP subunit
MNKKTKQFRKKLIVRIQVAGCALVILAFLGISVRIVHSIQLRWATESQATLTVATIKALKGPKQVEMVIPGDVWGWHETTVYARTNGYVARWLVDFGSHVKKDDLLAEISSPEVDAELRQAEAELLTAQANFKLAQITANRWKNLWKTDSVSKQETDEKISNEEAMAAVVASARANRDHLRELVSFEKVVAPFDGTIMSRTTDIGRLVNAGSSGPVALFRIVQTNPLRVYVRVPEYFSANVVPGIKATLAFPQIPGKTFPATLLDTAEAIDASTRTLLVQLQVDNANNVLLAGSYSQVHLQLPAIHAVILPVNTLVFRREGMQVATLDKESKVVFKSITIGNDFGDTVEVVAGVVPNETIILNPPDSLLNNQTVRVMAMRPSLMDKKTS